MFIHLGRVALGSNGNTVDHSWNTVGVGRVDM
jgi:hypothetical protein